MIKNPSHYVTQNAMWHITCKMSHFSYLQQFLNFTKVQCLLQCWRVDGLIRQTGQVLDMVACKWHHEKLLWNVNQFYHDPNQIVSMKCRWLMKQLLVYRAHVEMEHRNLLFPIFLTALIATQLVIVSTIHVALILSLTLLAWWATFVNMHKKLLGWP